MSERKLTDEASSPPKVTGTRVLLSSLDASVLVPAVIAAASACLLTYTFFPGYMSFDSLYQWKQVKGDLPLHDGFPLIMVYLWRVFSWLWDSPGTLLVFHQSVHWGAILLFSFAVARTALWRSLVVAVLGYCPPLLIHSIHLWKDEGMLAGFTLSVAALVLHGRSPRVSLLVVAAVGLFYATAVRHNAITGTVVLLVFLATAIVRQLIPSTTPLRWSIRKPDRRIIATAGATVALVVATILGTALISKTAPAYNGFSMIQTWDIAAISVSEKRNLLPTYIEQVDPSTPMLTSLQPNINPTNLLQLTKVIDVLVPQQYEEAYTQHWLNVIEKYPSAYLKHRLSVFVVLVGLAPGKVYYPYTPGIDANDMGIGFANLQEPEKKAVDIVFAAFADTPFYRAWIYIALSGVIGVYLTFRLFTKGLSYNALGSWLLAGSVFGIVLPLFLATPAPDFRYILWVVMATLMSIMLLARDAYDGRQKRVGVETVRSLA